MSENIIKNVYVALSGLSRILDYLPDNETWSHHWSLRQITCGKTSDLDVKIPVAAILLTTMSCWKTGGVVANVNKIYHFWLDKALIMYSTFF